MVEKERGGTPAREPLSRLICVYEFVLLMTVVSLACVALRTVEAVL